MVQQGCINCEVHFNVYFKNVNLVAVFYFLKIWSIFCEGVASVGQVSTAVSIDWWS